MAFLPPSVREAAKGILLRQAPVFQRGQAELVVECLGKAALALVADPGGDVLHPLGGRAQQLGGSFEPAAAEVGEIPLAQHVLAVQLEAALAQTKMVGQLPGRAADREVLQNQRLGLAHAFDLPRGAAAVSASSGRRSSSYSSRTAA